MRSVVPVHPAAEVVPIGRFELHDLETLRLLLRGSSVVDWYRLHFPSKADIDAFIRVNELDPDDPQDCSRLLDLRDKAVRYLREHLGYRVPDAIQEALDIRVLFEHASQIAGRRSLRLYACLTLKVMHIIHHVEGYELLFMLPISTAEMAVLLQAKIERVVRGLLERSFPIVEFSGNTKSSYSVISKLLAKKDTQSAQVFDKLRFRIVVGRLDDIPSLLLALTRELVPFNYLVPGQAQNSLLDIERQLVRAGNLTAIRARDAEQSDVNEAATGDLALFRRNEFSGPDYSVVNFIADIPLRVDRVISIQQNPRFKALGPVVFGTVEFQVVDRTTALRNETGANRHSLYKSRQRSKVKERLERGKRRKEAVVARAGWGRS